MRLSRIEIKGFKSFAEETHIIFNDDVIGIVGPNGSGKSNIVDAIRWVLGEQSSRELRLESMGDVIFNGSRTKKAAQMARVSLTFENTKNLLPTEYSEVTLTRKVFRTGESEYRINDVKCRLKDIQNLFMDSGIGSDSYAIIALGMVDDILDDKENARRKMFEEAAGISKYKQRKKETLRKLQHTSEDLDRIEDLVFEIEKNMKSFERQARRTKRFYEIRDEYREKSLQLAGIQLHHHRKKEMDIREKLNAESTKLRELEGKIAGQEAEIERVKNENIGKEQALTRSQKEINELISDIRTIEENLRIDRQQKDFRERERNEHSARITTLTEEKQNLEKSFERYQERMEEAKNVLGEAEVHLEKIKNEREELRNEYEDSRYAYDEEYEITRELEKEVTDLEKAMAIAQSNEDSYHREMEKLEYEISEKEGLLEEKQKEIEALQEEDRQWKEKIDKSERRIAEMLAQKTGLVKTKEETVKGLQRQNRNLDAKTNERNLLREFVNKMEGFPESTKFLSRHRSWKEKGVILSDILSADPPYRSLLENYLDQYLNYFVVQSVEDAVEAIQLLTKTDKGRAQFFILDEMVEMKSGSGSDTLGKPALEVVRYEDRFKVLFHNLLQNVYFSEEIPEDGSGLPAEAVIIQTDGAVQRGRGRMTGGVISLFEGSKLGRRQQIDQLEEEIKHFSDQIKTQEKELKDLDHQIAAMDPAPEEKELAGLKKKSADCQSGLTRIETTLDIEKRTLDQKKEGFSQLQEQLKRDAEQVLRQRSEWERAKSSLEHKQILLKEKDAQYRMLSDRFNDLNQKYNEANIRLIQQKNTVTALEREHEIIREKLQSKDEEIVYSNQRVEESKNLVEKLVISIGEREEEWRKALEVRTEKEALLSGAEKAYYKARSEISRMEGDLKIQNQEYRNSQALINGWKDALNSALFAMSRITERVEIEFETEKKDIPVIEDEEMLSRETETAEECEKLKKRIQNYGEINPLAVEAYDEIKERYDSIVEQRDDVLRARDQLMETIDEIETKATQKFMEAFNQVRDNFREVFRRLFTEDDTCDLLLLDAENPLESKIEIVAKPKGKKPQSISQLSGGEKTLTAIALLFGLYLLKPAPFCIFDEVDAPLDDSNIYKFNKIIKEFSSASQFVIVTHNKLTMESVDVIFGVFMENTGVSKVAAVDFRHLDQVAEFATAG